MPLQLTLVVVTTGVKEEGLAIVNVLTEGVQLLTSPAAIVYAPGHNPVMTEPVVIPGGVKV
jgi:hypothetical protein